MIEGKGMKRTFNVPYKHIKDFVFEPIMRRVINLMDKQIEETLKYSSEQIDAIVLVGGFGSSKYLKTRLQETYKDIKVVTPKNGLNVVSQGAVSYGLNHRMVSHLTLDDKVDESEKEPKTDKLTSLSSMDTDDIKLALEKVDSIVGIGMTSNIIDRNNLLQYMRT